MQGCTCDLTTYNTLQALPTSQVPQLLKTCKPSVPASTVVKMKSEAQANSLSFWQQPTSWLRGSARPDSSIRGPRWRRATPPQVTPPRRLMHQPLQQQRHPPGWLTLDEADVLTQHKFNCTA